MLKSAPCRRPCFADSEGLFVDDSYCRGHHVVLVSIEIAIVLSMWLSAL